MKKSLLALAVLGAFATVAQAQTNVSIGGVVQANVKSYKLSSVTAAGRVARNELRVDDDYTSRFWLTGTEDLGGGLSALFYVENRFNTDQGSTGTGNGLGNGDTFLGLKGGFGQVTIGKHSMMNVQGLTTEILTGSGTIAAMPSSSMATMSILNQNGAGNGAFLASYLDAGRRMNSIMYRTPNFSGFSASLGISPNSAGNEGTIGTPATAVYNDGREIYAQAGYANGPLSVSLAYRNNETEGRGTVAAPVTDDQQARLSAFYKFGAFKVGFQADRSERQTVALDRDVAGGKVARSAYSIPVSFAFGNNTILASATKANDRTGVRDSGAKFYTLGWDYALSKRTNVGVFYNRLDNDANGAYQPYLATTGAGLTVTGTGPQNGETASTFALGVKHTF